MEHSQGLWANARRLLLALGAAAGLLGGCSGGGDDAEPAPIAPPVISSQPLASTVSDGQAAGFSVVASGESLSFQWQKNAANVAGATAATLAIPAAALADNGASYRVVVSNGGGSVTSSAAALTVNPVAPGITSQPAAASVADGAVASFTVSASGSQPLAYQWLRNGISIAGATTASYTLNPVRLGDSGATFSVRVSNVAGPVTSSAVALLVNPAPVSITAAPQAATTVEGARASFSAAATGSAPLAYQWRRGGVDIPGANAASYTTPVLALADNGARFSVRVSNAVGPVTSAEAVLSVTAVAAAPSITTQPVSTSVTVGQTAAFSVTSGGTAPFSYQWQLNGVDISGATGASYTTPTLVLADSGARYSVRVGNAAGFVTSAEAVLTVAAPAASGFGSLAVSGPGVPSGYTFVPTLVVPRAGAIPVGWAAQGGFQQLNVTMWELGGAFTGVSIVASPSTFGGLFGVNLNCNVGGTPQGCDFAALRIRVDTTARTLTFENSPIPDASFSVSGTLRW